MSILARMFRREAVTTNLSNPAAWFVNAFAGEATAAGVRVNPAQALRVAAVFACVRILAETIGSLPLHVYRRLPNGGKERAPDHPLYGLLHSAPNPEMTSLEWRETIQGHLALRGNGYSQVLFGSDGRAAGRPVELIPLNPDRLHLRRDDTTREIRYEYTTDTGATRVFRFGEVLHERSLGGNGLVGYSPIRMAAEAVGVSLAAEEHGARFFSNGANPSGVLQKRDGSGDGTLSDPAYERLRKTFAEAYSGRENARKPLILEDGFTWQGISLNHEQAQFIETRKFQINEIGRIFRIPPHMIGDLERATFSNIEQQSIEFVMHTILPWVVRKEQRYNATLLLPSERAEYFCEFALDGLLRADAKTRAEALQIQLFNGALNPNEWRAIENRNPYDGGDRYFMQSAMVPVSQIGAALVDAKRGADPSTDPRLGAVLYPVLKASAERALRKELKALRALAKRSDAPAEIARFYTEHRGYLAAQVAPAFESLGLALGRDLAPQARTIADTFCAEQQRLATVAAGDATAFDALLTSWESSRAADLARRATEQLDNNIGCKGSLGPS